MEPETLPQPKNNITTETDSTTIIYLEEKNETAPAPSNEDIDYDILRVFYAAGF